MGSSERGPTSFRYGRPGPQSSARASRLDERVIRTFPAITLWQPWASLLLEGFKDHETRSFRLPDRLVGEAVAIHAAKRPLDERKMEPELSGLCRAGLGTMYVDEVPRGAILGLVRFGPPVRTESLIPLRRPRGEWGMPISREDYVGGDWSLGRWAWPVLDRKPLDVPVPTTGRQGWWKVELDGVRL